jgi:hypothetical protein
VAAWCKLVSSIESWLVFEGLLTLDIVLVISCHLFYLVVVLQGKPLVEPDAYECSFHPLAELAEW